MALVTSSHPLPWRAIGGAVCTLAGFVDASRRWRHVVRCQSSVASEAQLPLSSQQPLFRFGIISDVQYADVKDGTSFSGGETRSYRGSLHQVARAVAKWNELNVLFVAQLGDLIDGQNAGKYGEGLKFDKPQSEVALERVLEEFRRLRAPIFHAIGNHELYNFDWAQLRQRLNDSSRGWKVADAATTVGGECSSDGFHFTTHPHPGWTFIMLNSYNVSMMQDKSLPGYQQAREILDEYNPNDVESGKDFFAGLVGKKKRYVPFNGGLGHDQLKWLRREVVAARERDDWVVVLTHVPLHHESSRASWKTICYDNEECLKVLHEDGAGRVVAVLAGHAHGGGYVCDAEGLHHVTLPAPLTHAEAFGHIDVYLDRLEIIGSGALMSKSLRLPEKHAVPPTATPSARL